MTAPFAIRHEGADADRATLAVSRGLHYGDGVFRTLLRFDGAFVDLEPQLAKLAHDAAALSLDVPHPDALRAEMETLCHTHSSAVLKILLTRSGRARGYGSESSASERLLLAYPVPEFEAVNWRRGIDAIVSSVALAGQPRLAGIKHLNRLEQVLASRGWPEGVSEAIQLSASGAPVCGTRSNLFWVRHGCLQTPALNQCGVAGVMRDRVMTAAGRLAIPYDVGVHPLDELRAAEEIFVCNSVIGLWPVRHLSGVEFDWRGLAPGPVTQALTAALAHPLRDGT